MNRLPHSLARQPIVAIKTIILGPLVLWLSVQGTEVSALDDDSRLEPSTMPSYETVLTCAVYYRMIAGQLRQNQHEALAAGAMETMQTLIERGRKIGNQNGLTASDYNSDWSSKVTEMTDRINRNYANIRQLKLRYARRCESLSP
jgi:hypothetical protein